MVYFIHNLTLVQHGSFTCLKKGQSTHCLGLPAQTRPAKQREEAQSLDLSMCTYLNLIQIIGFPANTFHSKN